MHLAITVKEMVTQNSNVWVGLLDQELDSKSNLAVLFLRGTAQSFLPCYLFIFKINVQNSFGFIGKLQRQYIVPINPKQLPPLINNLYQYSTFVTIYGLTLKPYYYQLKFIHYSYFLTFCLVSFSLPGSHPGFHMSCHVS